MNIGIDLDEVVTDYIDSLCIYLRKKQNIAKKKEEFTSINWLDQIDPSHKVRKKIIMEWLASTDYDAIHIANNAKVAIEDLTKTNKVFFFTSRHPSQHEATTWWLEKHIHAPFEIVYTSNQFAKKDEQIKESKMDLCVQHEIKLFITHHYQFALECAQKKIPVIVFDKPWNKGEALNRITRVTGWLQVVEIQKEAAARNAAKMQFQQHKTPQNIGHRRKY